jgi:hypothetical protein
MTQLFTGAPIWVWPLLVVLVMVGLRARHERTVPAVLLYALPILGVMAVRSTAALPAGAVIWGVFALAYLAGASGGFVMQRRWLLGREGNKVQLAGEGLTLFVMMVIFWANFAGGILQGAAPVVYNSNIFHIVFVTLVAICSGSFLGRALRVWKDVV